MNKIVLLIVIFSFCLSCNAKNKNNPPLIQKGILNLSNIDLQKNPSFSLKGKCEFYWKKKLSFSDFKQNPELKPDIYVQFPRIWNDVKINNKKIDRTGYATYRFKVKLENTNEELALKLNDIATAYDLYIDNKKLASVGKFGTSQDNTEPGRNFKIVTFKPDKKEFDIIFHVSNYHSNISGFWSKVYLGKVYNIHLRREIQLIINFFVFGCIFIMFIYHIWFFIFRRSDRSTLFFSLGCLFMSIYTLNSGEIILFDIFPNLPWCFTAKLMFISAYMSLGTFGYFMYYIFPEETNITLVHINNLFCMTCSIITIFAHMTVMIFIMQVFCVFLGIWTIYFSKIIVNAIINKTEGAVIYVIGSTLFLIAVANDIMVGFNIIHTDFLIPFGLLGFIFTQAILISKRFSKAYTMVENLSIDLENKNVELFDLNQNLEIKVEKRTEELSSAMEELEAMNNALGKTNNTLIMARESTKREMKLATNVQKSLFPKSLPKLKNWDIAFEFRPMTEVSGDLYDFYIEDDTLQGMNMSDVSGHGVASGLITMIARSAFDRNFYNLKDLPLNKVLEKINKELIREIDSVDNFLSSILLRFNENEVEYVNAGHTDLLRKKASTGEVEIIDQEENKIRGLYLGSSLLSGEYDAMKFKLQKNDVIFIFSDCIIESKNNEKEEFGEERLIKSIESIENNSASDILEAVLTDLYNFISRKYLRDDLTLIVMKYTG